MATRPSCCCEPCQVIRVLKDNTAVRLFSRLTYKNRTKFDSVVVFQRLFSARCAAGGATADVDPRAPEPARPVTAVVPVPADCNSVAAGWRPGCSGGAPAAGVKEQGPRPAWTAGARPAVVCKAPWPGPGGMAASTRGRASSRAAAGALERLAIAGRTSTVQALDFDSKT